MMERKRGGRNYWKDYSDEGKEKTGNQKQEERRKKSWDTRRRKGVEREMRMLAMGEEDKRRETVQGSDYYHVN